MMKLASHRIYDARLSRLYSFQVLERGKDGTFRIYPFREEISGTEWLPGMLILAPFAVTRVPGEGFRDFLTRLKVAAGEEAAGPVEEEPAMKAGNGEEGWQAGKEIRVYWITPFNVTDMEFLPDSQIRELR